MLKDKEYIKEIPSGNNFGYVLMDNSYFVSTDYKVLQNQSNGIFIKCMKMLYNGKTELFYVTDEYRPMSSMFIGITPDVLINVIVNLFGSIMEEGIYDYFIKTLTPYEASKLGEKYGKGNIVLSAISSVAEIGENSVKMHDVMVDENSNAYDKVGQAINVGGSLADFYGKLKIAKMSGTKSLRIVNNLEGCSKGVKNQILATESSLKYTTAATVGKKISTASTYIDIFDAGVSAVSSGVKRYGQVSKDGKVDIVDGASVGIYSATNGLSKLASSVTFGVVSFDGDKTAKELEDDVTNMVNSNSKLVQYIGNKNNPIVLRGLAAGCGAAELVGKKVVSGFCKVAEKAGKAAQTVWTVYDELNKAYGM